MPIQKNDYFGSIALVFSLLIVWLELQTKLPKAVLLTFPVIGVLIIYNLYVLLGGYEKVMSFFSSYKGSLSLVYFLLFTGLCLIPVNGLSLFARYVSPSPNPFRNYQWLATSFVGILFSLSLLNYNLRHPENPLVKTARMGRAMLRMKAQFFLLLCSILVFTLTNFFSWAVFEHIPHVQDEIAQFLQAKIFASGNLTAPLPPIVDFFHHRYDNMIFTNRWYSEYPPAHPFFLMFGVIYGAPWIINPLFASLSCILLYNIATQYYGEKEARLSVILFSISPFVLFMSSSFMNHVSILFFMLLFIYTINKSESEKSSLYAFISGLSLGIGVNIRPQEALIIGALYGIFFLVRNLSKRTYLPLIAFLSAVALMGGVLPFYNYATNGDPLLFGYQVHWGKGHFLGFHNVSVLDRPPHTPLRGLMNTLSNFFTLNQDLFEWPFPSLFPLVIFWTPFLFKKNWHDRFLLCGLFTAPILYFFYFFQDLCLGPRYLYISLPFIFMLTARALLRIIAEISSLKHYTEEHVKDAFFVLLLLSVMFTGFVRMPRLYQFYSNSFWHVDNKLMKKAQAMGIENALIFQKSYYYEQDKGSNVGSGLLHNSPGLSDSIVFARDLGERNAELVPFFPGRRYYIASKDEKGEIKIEPLNIRILSPGAGKGIEKGH